MSKANTERKIPFTEIATNLDKALDQADPLREAGLTQLSRVSSAKLTAQAREQARLTKKLGASHPRVQALAKKREANTALLREVNLTLARAATPAVDINDDTWLVHGRVMDRARQGLPGLTITLIDAKGRWVQELGYVCTDKLGYFRLSVEKTEAAAAVSNIPEDGRDMQVYLRVADRDNNVLHTDKPPLIPSPGQIDYREITLGEPRADCRAPDGDGAKTFAVIPDDSEKKKKTRYLANTSTHEFHDLNNEKKNCRIDQISFDHWINFKTQKEATEAGYDFCAFCFGKDKSKR